MQTPSLRRALQSSYSALRDRSLDTPTNLWGWGATSPLLLFTNLITKLMQTSCMKACNSLFLWICICGHIAGFKNKIPKSISELSSTSVEFRIHCVYFRNTCYICRGWSKGLERPIWSTGWTLTASLVVTATTAMCNWPAVIHRSFSS